jgi:hypothetical protein
VSTNQHRVVFPWPGPAGECWEATRELAAPFKRLIEAIPPEQTEEVVREVLEGIRRFQAGDSINLPATVTIAGGSA